MQSINSQQYFESMHQQLYRKLVRFALGLTRNAQEAEDLVQEAFYRALRNSDRIQLQTIEKWMRQVIRNLFFDRYNALRKRPVTYSLDSPIFESDDSVINGFDLSSNQDFEAQVLLRDRCRRAFDKLTDEQRQLVWLKTVVGLSFKEIGPLQQMTPAAAKTRFYRAISILRQYLSAENEYPMIQLAISAPISP